MPCSVQNDGSASAGADVNDIVTDLFFLRAGDGRFVSVEALLAVDEPREDGRNEFLLLCFFAVRNVCAELWRRGGGTI
jgi:hypothetical protein